MAPVPWLENELLAQAALVFVWVWANAGFYMMIFIAGLMMIPGDYYEAAAIERGVALADVPPHHPAAAAPTMLIALVLASVEAFKVYEVVVSLTHGGPGRGDGLPDPGDLRDRLHLSLRLGRLRRRPVDGAVRHPDGPDGPAGCAWRRSGEHGREKLQGQPGRPGPAVLPVPAAADRGELR